MTVTLADQARILGTCSSTRTVSQEGSKEHVGMADDVLVEKLFNYICGSGGFVELSVLLKHDSPLGSRKSAGEAEIWLKNQRKFGLVKDRDGNIAGVRVDFRKKLCQQYVSKGSCRKTAGFCQHWHICKKFIEGKCSVHDNCGLSHNFRIGPNRDLLKELCLENYPNGSLRKIIAWSLPHVCQSYLRGKCQPHKCSYIHACYKEIQGLQCRCSLSHSLFDNRHNLAVLNLYDIVPTNVAFVRCSVLCLGEDPHSVHQDNSSHETSFLEGETAISETSSTGTEVQMLNSNTSTMTAAKSTPATLSDVSGEVTNPPGAILASGISPNSRFRGVGASDYLFRRLCKEFKCTVPLSELLERKVVLFNELQDFKNIVDENPDKLLAFPDERGVISPTSRISAICPKLRLCHDHVSNNECKKTDCHNFHLCRKFITGCCSRGERCFRNHSFQNRRDRNTLFQLQLDGLTDEQLRHLMLASLPQVCNDYNKGTCSLGVFCFRVHICKQFVINSCPNESVCSLDHYHALQSQRTRSLIQRLRFHPTNRDNILNTILVYEGEEPDSSPKTKGEVSDTINHLASSDSGDESTRSEPGTSISNKTTTPEALNENLVYEGKEYCNPKTKGEVSSRVSDSGDESTRSQERSESVTSVSNKTTTSKALNENLVKSQKSWTAATASQRSYGASLGNENESYPITQRSETNERAPCYPDKWHVFQTLCREYDCSTSLKEIAKRPDLFPHGISSAESWFRRTVGNFLIKESDTKTEEISRIDAFSADARLCLSWVENQTCHEEHCQCFHVCKSYISDSCSLGASCPMNHSFRNDRDRALLSKVRLDCLSEEQLCKLVLLSSPQVCKDYNNSICTSGNSCGKIHICCGYLRNCCRGVWECGLEHEGTFNTKQTQDVLQHLRMNNISSKNTLKLIFDDKRCLTSKDKMTKCLIHVDKPDAPICLSFLVGTCKLGEKCSDHHCPLPYHWQYKVPNVEVWNSFSEKDNVTLERLYCDVNNARMNYKPVEILDFSLAGSTVVSPAQEYTITVDLDDMVIFLTPLNSQGTRFISELRRLSTVDGSVAPRSEKSMNWIWYWEENGKVWRTYDKDCSERDLQKLMEQAYLDYLKQGAERENTRYFRFAVAERKYDLVFSRTEMHQINLRSGTKRRVRRRPGKVISNEDMEDLKWWYGDSSFQEEVLRLLRAEKKYFPSHWSSMPPKSEYYRANVDRSSEEFKDLEKLFRSTMNDYTVRIENIDRVQNVFMMEKYCRKKECMTATAARSQQTVDERKLFHGTTPDAVEDICKHNFDWRLHGRNTSVFGEGSYFARDASNSHTFAKEDASGFRHVFVAKVLVGSYTKGHSSYRRPPPKVPSDPRSNLYDSCVDNQSNPSVFVVFDTDQLYPEYIITYSTVSRSDSSDSHHDSSSQRSATPKMASPKTGDPVVPLEQDPSSSQAQASHQTSTTLTREIVQTPSSQTLASTKGPTSRSTYSTTTIASSQEEPSLPNSPSATGNTSNSISMLSTLRNQFPSKFPSSEQKKDDKCLIS